MNAQIIDETGYQYGRLYVLDYAGSDATGAAMWLCRCDCGEMVTVRGANLRSGNTRSCGCLSVDMATERIAEVNGRTDV